MTVLLAFAFVSGVITILSPCILPVLPIVLSGGVSGGRARPFGVIAGFVASFTVFTVTLSALVQAIGINADSLRVVAVVLIAAFGAVMIVPALRDRFELLASRVANIGRGGAGRRAGGGAAPAGFWGGVLVGLSLGLVWTPCVGPIMASVISLALTHRVDGGSVLITLTYSLGTAVPMLAVMFGGRALIARVPALSRNTAGIQRGFGVVMILVAVAIGLGWDRRFQTAVLAALPSYGSGLTALENTAPVRTALQAREAAGGAGRGGAGAADPAAFSAPPYAAPQNGTLGDYGVAPRFVTRGLWFNTEGIAPATGQPAQGGSMPLSMDDLKGKVVVIDFWTYSCVNCVRTLPYLRAWYDAYKSRGLVIVGVHTPEFEFEKSPANVAKAMRELGVTWPVVQDNDYQEWNAYANQYWPAHYFIDAKGEVRYFHFGEGEYDVSERVIQALLREAGADLSGVASRAPSKAATIDSQTPETYLGYDRISGFATAVKLAPDTPADYRPAHPAGNGEWSLDGRWTITPQYAVPETQGTLELGFDAKNVFLVVEPQGPGGSIEVALDGRPAPDTPDVRKGNLAPGESRMYQVVGLPKRGAHVLRLAVKGKLRLFAFTFG